MRRFVLYILAFCCIFAGCEMQQIEQGNEVADTDGTVTIRFKVSLPNDGMATKGFGEDWRTDINSLHLVVFDENGYFIAIHEAEIDHEGDQCQYKVTLHKTDKKRIIHFIANCPTSQIEYGHESNVISNLRSIKGTDFEAAYWHRIEVWYILTDEHGYLDPLIAESFKNITLLRNYACVNVTDEVDDFVLEGYAIYNTISVGTIAPFNTSAHKFQSFLDENGDKYSYEQLTKNFEYYGHALSRVNMNTTLTELDFINPSLPTYMYERKISVRTEDEDKWHESPAHIILKGKYAGSASSSYYKVDMIDANHTYYNILRNFKYTFVIKSVAGSGYPTLQEAMDNPAGNNLSGSTDTQDYVNISDGVGRIFVSFTDTTLISSDPIKLRYKYIPRINDYNTTDNDIVEINGVFDGSGSVIKSATKAEVDGNNTWEGWREITIQPQNPGDITHIQEIQLKVPDNPNLNKTVRVRLKKQYTMTVECTPDKVAGSAGYPVTVNIGLPRNLTEDLFPLRLAIEVEKYSLSPDATVVANNVIVEPGLSIIPENAGKDSYYFIKAIETYEEYQAIQEINEKKYIPTYWVTNKKESASTVYVYNKYFQLAYDNFTNPKYAFSNLNFTNGVMASAGSGTEFTFEMPTITEVTVKLEGLQDANGNVEFKYTPTKTGKQTFNLKTVNASGTVKVTLDADDYAPGILTADQMTTISKMTVTFNHKYRNNQSPSASAVEPKISIPGATVSYTYSTSRSGSNNNYTYTTTYTNVKISGASPDSDVTISYSYTVNNSAVTYMKTVKLSTLLNTTNPSVTLDKQ